MKLRLKLNKEELAVGAVVGLAFAPILHWWAIPTGIGCSILWALGGSSVAPKFLGLLSSRHWRRMGVPILLCGIACIAKNSWIPAISILPVFGMLTKGYGIPTYNEHGALTDAGSWLGRLFYYSIANHDEDRATYMTRAAYGLGIGLGCITFALGSIWAYILGVTILTISIPIAVIVFEGEWEIKW